MICIVTVHGLITITVSHNNLYTRKLIIPQRIQQDSHEVKAHAYTHSHTDTNWCLSALLRIATMQVILLYITYLASLTEWTEHAYRTGYVGTVRLAPTNNTVLTVLNQTFSKHECFKYRHVPTCTTHAD